jgi:hypothetical protein
MTPREQEEYTALRATIRERGTARVWIFLAGVVAWAAIVVATTALASTPVATLLPLLVLAATFEAVFALHVGVERVGRYVQVFFEEDGRGWEHAAMAFGRPPGAAVVDALFSVPFGLAAIFNVAPALITNPSREELVFVAGAHALFLIRLVSARAAAARQRAVDLERFRNSFLSERNRQQ